MLAFTFQNFHHHDNFAIAWNALLIKPNFFSKNSAPALKNLIEQNSFLIKYALEKKLPRLNKPEVFSSL